VNDIIHLEVLEEADLFTSETLEITITEPNGTINLTDIVLTKNLAPDITINTPSFSKIIYNRVTVNATAVNQTSFNTSAVLYALENASGNYSKTGQSGYSLLQKASGSDFYSDSLNTTVFSDGTYTLWVVANNTKGRKSYSSENITIRNIDLMVNSSSIQFSPDSPYETQNITISAVIYNLLEKPAEDVIVQFYRGPITPQNQIGGNQTIDVPGLSQVLANTTLLAGMGLTNISVLVDPPISENGTIPEMDESNNIADGLLTIGYYQVIVGNVTGSLVLANKPDRVDYGRCEWLKHPSCRQRFYCGFLHTPSPHEDNIRLIALR
jgi:phage gp45-like